MQPIKNGQNGPNGVRILLRHNGHLISVQLWNHFSTFIPKHFLQKLTNPLVAKRTIYGRSLGRPVDSWLAFGDRATVFQQHWSNISLDYCPFSMASNLFVILYSVISYCVHKSTYCIGTLIACTEPSQWKKESWVRQERHHHMATYIY